MKIKLAFVAILLLIAILPGCGAADIASSEDADNVPGVFQTIKGMEVYLNELSAMDYGGTVEITVSSVHDSTDIYNLFIANYKNAKCISGWKNGAFSTFLSRLPGLARSASAQEGESRYLVYNEFVDFGEYNMYLFTADDDHIPYKYEKVIAVIVEKGTETSDKPHFFIYKFEQIMSISRADMMVPITNKIFINVTELGAYIREDNMDIEWVDYS